MHSFVYKENVFITEGWRKISGEKRIRRKAEENEMYDNASVLNMLLGPGFSSMARGVRTRNEIFMKDR